MKVSVLVPLFVATAVSAWTDCQNQCAGNFTDYGCSTSKWEDTACLCNGDFKQQVKVCLYKSGCNTDVPSWFTDSSAACAAAGVAEVNATGTYGSKPSGASSSGGGRPAATSDAAAAATTSSSAATGSMSFNAAGVTAVVLAVVGGALVL